MTASGSVVAGLGFDFVNGSLTPQRSFIFHHTMLFDLLTWGVTPLVKKVGLGM
jgi:hypothetical protein